MPLFDHFHAPLSQRRSWEGFPAMWAAALVEQLNRDVLPDEHFADMQVHVGRSIEVEVASLDEREDRAGGGTAILAWAPPAAALAIPAVFPEVAEVQVLSTATGAHLVGAIELVSPGNKDRDDNRRAFVAKCETYLSRRIGLVVVDIVTSRLANLHNDLMALRGQGPPFLLPPDSRAYAVAYRPRRLATGGTIEMWPHVLGLGEPLPVLPLALRDSDTVPVDLEEAYMEARTRSRLD
ncbi:MAG: DUF4058 family protein [Gemmataceae bacterium]|nr:DUF4058 family protein [Gemmataceae bacterium]